MSFPEQKVEDAMEIDREAWEWQTLLNYFVNTYEKPSDVHEMDNTEWLDWLQDLSTFDDAEEYIETFEEAVEYIDENLESHTIQERDNLIDVIYDPDNMNEARISIEYEKGDHYFD